MATPKSTRNDDLPLFARPVTRAYKTQLVTDQIPAEDITALYVDRKWSAEAIAAEYGVGAGTIRRMLKRLGVTKNPRPYTEMHLQWSVSENGCWLWTGPKSRKGYGVAWDQQAAKNRAAHRVMYERHKGGIPDGLQVDHTCRRRNCVNPDHLTLVTNAENQQRGAKAKVTADDVREMRRLYASGKITQERLARRYGIHEETVRGILHRRTWANIT